MMSKRWVKCLVNPYRIRVWSRLTLSLPAVLVADKRSARYLSLAVAGMEVDECIDIIWLPLSFGYIFVLLIIVSYLLCLILTLAVRIVLFHGRRNVECGVAEAGKEATTMTTTTNPTFTTATQ